MSAAHAELPRRKILRDSLQAVGARRVAYTAYTPAARAALQVAAALLLVAYVGLSAALVLRPGLGLRLLWFLCVPLIPLVALAAPSAWASVCPLATAQTLARRLGWRKGRRLSHALNRRLQLAGWVLMFAVVPARHLLFNSDAAFSLAAGAALALAALAAGLACFGLSGWCAGACPVRPVEVLYALLSDERRRPEPCTRCTGCVAFCGRAARDFGVREFARTSFVRGLAYAFPGFVAAYFLLDATGLCANESNFFAGRAAVPDELLARAAVVYGVTALGSLASFALFGPLAGRAGASHLARLRAAALTAYAVYYLGLAPELSAAWSLSLNWSVLFAAVPLTVPAWLLLRRRD